MQVTPGREASVVDSSLGGSLPKVSSARTGPPFPPSIARSRYLLGQQGQPVPRLRGRRSGRLQEVVLGFGAGHGSVRVTAVWLPPGDYHHPSGSGRWARLRVGGWAEAWRTKAKRRLT